MVILKVSKKATPRQKRDLHNFLPAAKLVIAPFGQKPCVLEACMGSACTCRQWTEGNEGGNRCGAFCSPEVAARPAGRQGQRLSGGARHRAGHIRILLGACALFFSLLAHPAFALPRCSYADGTHKMRVIHTSLQTPALLPSLEG